MMFRTAVVVSVILCINDASAADLPVRSYSKAPAVAVPVHNWSGFYAGINGGYGWTAVTSDITYYATDPGGTFLANRDRGFDAKGAFGGFQTGYNWQRDRLVFGIEADFELSDIKDKFTQIVGPAFVFERDTFFGKMEVKYFGTARGRVGYSFDRSLLFVTGGFAFADINQRQDSLPPPDRLALGAVPVFREQNGIRTGYVVGAGLEHKFDPSWSLKGEYQYLNFGSAPLNGVVPGAPVTLTTSDITNSFHVQTRMLGEMQEAARAKGVQLPVLYAGSESEIDAAFASLVQGTVVPARSVPGQTEKWRRARRESARLRITDIDRLPAIVALALCINPNPQMVACGLYGKPIRFRFEARGVSTGFPDRS